MTFSVQTFLYDIDEEDEELLSPAFQRSTSTVPAEKSGMMELRDVSFERIREAGVMDLCELSQMAGIQEDELLQDSEDIRERLILIKKKAEGSSHTWKHLFTSVREEANAKVEVLIDLMNTVLSTFKTIPTDSLSQILRSEGHLHQPDLVEELSIRMENLKDRQSTVVVAGETNGGKSSFLNLLLGMEILPTNFLHCTFVVTKIVYSKTFCIKTLHHDGTEELDTCASCEEAMALLTDKVSQQEMRERQSESPIKEITLGLPADILKSGVTLVDTPGIGEDDMMDNVTMNFVKSTHASAFIYIIKSDTAGGVQEDRLLSFLRAIKERYQSDVLRESFDPRAAMFVCHRWDNIEEDQREKVKRNALDRLEYVWPGFDASQTYFFSTRNTMKHLPVDAEFVTDSYYQLLKGLKDLFDRASHNAIKCQYIWLKYMLQPAANHLRSMITHCIRSNEELEKYFKSVAVKQERLMASSKENSARLQAELDSKTEVLRAKVYHYLNFDIVSPRMELDDYDELVAECSQDNYLTSRENRGHLDEMIIRSLMKYADEHVSSLKLVHDMESSILQAIQDHLGLFKSQIQYIKNDMLHGGSPYNSQRSLDGGDESFGGSTGSLGSTGSSSDSIQGLQEEMTLDPGQLARTVKSLLQRRKEGKTTATQRMNSRHEFRQSLLSKIKDRIIHGVLKAEPQTYIDERVQKLARDVRENDEIMNNIVSGYAEWIQECVNYATNSIPKFIAVNTKLMDEIREHRGGFQRDKDLLIKVMEELEPMRHQLRGYGLLYMDDINADCVAFNVDRRHSTIFVPKDLISSYKMHDDSGFMGLWSKMKGATIQVDNKAERVVVKTYSLEMDDIEVLSEIASLRCLDDMNIAPFFGMTRLTSGSTRGDGFSSVEMDVPKEKVSAFIFKGDLVSARVFAARRMTNLQQFVPQMVLALLRGLNYIHRERLVHMELNLDTVMVDKETGEVKLCQMCKPREAVFPAQLDCMTRSCVCLSPSVLQGQIYENTDDMYAFGLLLWELLFPHNPPYKEQRMWPLKQFMEECHPNNMLQEDLGKLTMSDNVRSVLKGTLLVSRGIVCMPIANVESLLSDLSTEQAVLDLKPRKSHVVIPRQGSTPGTPPEIRVTDTSGKHKKVIITLPEDQLSGNPSPGSQSPIPPPRFRRKLKPDSRSTSAESNVESKHNQQSLPAQMGARDGRRQSEPIISAKAIQVLGLHAEEQKRKGSFFSRLFRLSKHKRRPSAEVELLRQFLAAEYEKDNSDLSDNSASSSRTGSLLSVQVDPTRRASVDVVNRSPPNLLGRPELKDTRLFPHRNAKDSRRFSLQDQSLSAYRPAPLQRKDSFDVPRVLTLEKYQSPLRGVSSATNSPTETKRITQTQSLSCLHRSETDHKDAFHEHNGKVLNKNSEHSMRNSFSHSLNPKYFEHKDHEYGRARVQSLPSESISGSPRRSRKVLPPSNLSLGSSLQTLSDGSVDHISHTIEPIIESQETSSLAEEGFSQSGKGDSVKWGKGDSGKWGKGDSGKWGKGDSGKWGSEKGEKGPGKLQWKIGSQDGKFDNSSDSGEKAISSQTDANPSNEHAESSQAHTREQFFRSSRGENSSFDLDLSSSASSQGPDSGFCTDVSGRDFKRSHFFPTNFHDTMPDFSATSNLWDENVDSKTSLAPHTDSVIPHVRSSSAPLEVTSSQEPDSSPTTTSPSNEFYSLETVLNNNDIPSPSQDVASNSVFSSPMTEISPFPTVEEEVNEDSENVIQNFILSQQAPDTTDSNNNRNNNSAPPPPPPINFAELTFRRPSYDEDEPAFSFFS